MDCDSCIAMGIGVMGGLFILAPTISDLLKEGNIWKKLLVLIGVVLVGVGFFGQCGWGGVWYWVVDIVVVGLVILAIWCLRKKKAK